jgi:hypothetical protein
LRLSAQQRRDGQLIPPEEEVFSKSGVILSETCGKCSEGVEG